MHEAVLSWIGQFRTSDDLSVLDIGGRDLNGSPRSLFPNASPYHVLDLRPGPNVDIVADAAKWEPVFNFPAGEAGYDLVICTEVFEHCSWWSDILKTAYKALRPGGWLLFTCAGPGRPAHSGIEAVMGLIGDEWYANVSPQELRHELEFQGWTEVETHLVGTDTQGKAIKPLPVPDPIAGAPGLDPYATQPMPPEVVLSATMSRTAAGKPTA